MKKFIILILGIFCGIGLILFHDRIGSVMDDTFLEPQTLQYRADQFLAQGRPEEYEATLREIVLAPRTSARYRATAFYNLGACSLEKASQGHPTAAGEAVFYFREALRNDPSLFPAKYNLELLGRRAESSKEKEARDASGQSEREQRNEKKGGAPVLTPPQLGDNP